MYKNIYYHSKYHFHFFGAGTYTTLAAALRIARQQQHMHKYVKTVKLDHDLRIQIYHQGPYTTMSYV